MSVIKFPQLSYFCSRVTIFFVVVIDNILFCNRKEPQKIMLSARSKKKKKSVHWVIPFIVYVPNRQCYCDRRKVTGRLKGRRKWGLAAGG